MREIISPLNQFEIKGFLTLESPLFFGGLWKISLSNIGLYLMFGAFFLLAMNFLSTNYNRLLGNKWSLGQESLFATILGMVTSQINAREGQAYFPFIYALFIFILINNLIGMVPYSFASTSHLVLTFSLSFTIVLGSTVLGFIRHGLKFFSLLVPSGVPLALLPLLVLIEFISYAARCLSLGLRLAANIISGHLLLSILAAFTYQIMVSGTLFFFLGLLPLALIIAFSGLELGIALVQAQVFVILSCSYIKDGHDLH